VAGRDLKAKIASISIRVEVKFKWEMDESPDFSYLGEYTNKEDQGTLDRAKHGIRVGHNECRFFRPANHWPHDPKNWDHVSGKEKAEVIKKHGSLQNADLHYAVEDMRRMEAYEAGEWYMEGCVAIVRAGSLEARGSVWGVESDSSGDHKREIERDCLAEALGELEDKIGKRLEVE